MRQPGAKWTLNLSTEATRGFGPPLTGQQQPLARMGTHLSSISALQPRSGGPPRTAESRPRSSCTPSLQTSRASPRRCLGRHTPAAWAAAAAALPTAASAGWLQGRHPDVGPSCSTHSSLCTLAATRSESATRRSQPLGCTCAYHSGRYKLTADTSKLMKQCTTASYVGGDGCSTQPLPVAAEQQGPMTGSNASSMPCLCPNSGSRHSRVARTGRCRLKRARHLHAATCAANPRLTVSWAGGARQTKSPSGHAPGCGTLP